MNDPASKLTVFTPTHERPQHFSRALAYAATRPFRCLVYDSSARAFQGPLPKNVEYQHLPGVAYIEKFRAALHSIRTPYTVICADDDFLVTPTVMACLDFLEANRDYASVQGTTISFQRTPFGLMVSPAYLHARALDASADDIEERLKTFFHAYLPVYHAVQRTENLAQAFEQMEGLSFNTYEILQAFIALANGKHRVLPLFYQAREFLERSGGSNLATLRELTTRFPAEYARLATRLEDHLVRVCGMARPHATEVVTSAFNAYFDFLARMQTAPPQRWKRALAVAGRPGQAVTRALRSVRALTLRSRLRNTAGYPFGDPDSTAEWQRIEKFVTQ